MPTLTEAMLRRLDVPGPRYTSYPTADRFVEAFGPVEYLQALKQRAEGATVGGKPPLSLYIHVPFCESVCYYCACNKVITKHHDRAAEYIEALEAEVTLHTAVLGLGQSVSQVHFGGGSPTFLSDAELERLMAGLRDRSFRMPAAATSGDAGEAPEFGIEVDPAFLPRPEKPARALAQARLQSHVSVGVQDFDPEVVQKRAVQPPAERTRSVREPPSIETARADWLPSR